MACDVPGSWADCAAGGLRLERRPPRHAADHRSGRSLVSVPRVRPSVRGEVVGSGGLEVFEDGAVLVTGCVHPEARQRRVQSGFIAYRARSALPKGRCALVGSQPGGLPEGNACWLGFEPLFTETGLQRKMRAPPTGDSP